MVILKHQLCNTCITISVLASCEVDRRLGQTIDYSIRICCLPTNYTALKSKISCLSTTYSFWSPIWYLQTFLWKTKTEYIVIIGRRVLSKELIILQVDLQFSWASRCSILSCLSIGFVGHHCCYCCLFLIFVIVLSIVHFIAFKYLLRYLHFFLIYEMSRLLVDCIFPITSLSVKIIANQILLTFILLKMSRSNSASDQSYVTNKIETIVLYKMVTIHIFGQLMLY